MGLFDLFVAYLVGGFTFIPLIVILFIYLHPKKNKSFRSVLSALKAGEIEESKETGLDAYKSGWITVTQGYLESPDDISSSVQSISESADNKTAYASLYKLAQKDITSTEGPESVLNPPADINKVTSKSHASEKVNRSQKKHRFYGILKHGNLFLYKDEELKDVRHVIVLSNQIVTIWPRDVLDSELFAKRSSICIMKKDWSRSRRLSDSFDKDKITTSDILSNDNNFNPPKGSFFIYCDSNIDKEDWYFSLIRATKLEDVNNNLNPAIYAETLHFETHNMINLIQNLYSSEAQLETKWFNALVGRLFLSLQKTEVLQKFLKSKLEKKLTKIKRPGYLNRFQIGEISPGNSAPLLTFPTLKEISPDGTIVVSACIQYLGCFSTQVLTKANINLGSRFKPREVDLLLSICLEKLEGSIIIKIKPPPSDRLWYSFESEPNMRLNIEPVISSRQFAYNIITNLIEKKLKDAIKESLVLPHWDDVTFYDTTGEIYRGGIWDKSVRPENKSEEIVENIEQSESAIHDNGDDLDFKTQISYNKWTNNPKSKISTTLTDISRKIKKTKSAHTLGISEENCLSDGSLIDSRSKNDQDSLSSDSSIGKRSTMNTLRKIGKWYFKDERLKTSLSENYSPPEMILNRRSPRKSNADLTKPPSVETTPTQPSYDFIKYHETSISSDPNGNKMFQKQINNSVSPKPPTPLPPRDDISFDTTASDKMSEQLDLIGSFEENKVSEQDSVSFNSQEDPSTNTTDVLERSPSLISKREL